MANSGAAPTEPTSDVMTTRSASSSASPTLEKLAPGTLITVGSHKVEIVKYLAEGGFAHIYVVKFVEFSNELETPSSSLKEGDLACLKRVLVTDENGLNELRNEVEVMKQLKNGDNIVQYYDSNASRRRDGSPGYEVLLLMELCPNKSLLDYMNQRLATKLSEKEVLKIMYDVTKAVAQMHFLPTPLIHRDIKIENVLVDSENNFKLCDFGSTSSCFPIMTTHQDIALLTNNIYVHTTPQYRAPEMIDLYRCLPIDEKSDIWALGIFLYKLLFYTTPFELTGQFAILHSKYDIPANNYSSKLINLIIIMLAENPNLRPNIYQVIYQVCAIMKVDVPLEDKYQTGPYDFDKYSKYQEKLQAFQYQLYISYHQKQDVDTLNDLFINCFEIAPKQPMDMGKQDLGEKPENLEKIQNQQDSHKQVPTRDEEDIKMVQQHFPSVEDLDTYLHSEATHFENKSDRLSSLAVPNRSKSLGSSSHASSVTDLSNGSGNSPEEVSPGVMSSNPTAKSTASIKQHKSNNPFPKMQQQQQPQQQQPQFYQQNIDYFHDTSKEAVNPLALSAQQIGYFHSIPTEAASKTQEIAYFQDNLVRAQKTHDQHPQDTTNYLPEPVEPSEQYLQYYQQVPYPLPQQQQQKQQQTQKQQQPHQPHQPQQLQQPQQPQPQQLQQQDHFSIPSFFQSAAPQPSHYVQPQQKQVPQEELLIDLSPEKKETPSVSPPKLNITIDQVDLSYRDEDKTDEASVADESIASSESIAMDLKKKEKDTKPEYSSDASLVMVPPQSSRPSRRSLDLKFQEINFSKSPSPKESSQRHQHKESSQRHQHKKIPSSSEMRKSLSRARKSLDLEGVKRESAGGSDTTSKRKSFFGVFKS